MSCADCACMFVAHSVESLVSEDKCRTLEILDYDIISVLAPHTGMCRAPGPLLDWGVFFLICCTPLLTACYKLLSRHSKRRAICYRSTKYHDARVRKIPP